MEREREWGREGIYVESGVPNRVTKEAFILLAMPVRTGCLLVLACTHFAFTLHFT